MKEHEIDDRGLNPPAEAEPSAQHVEPGVCPECLGAGVTGDGEVCPLCQGTGRANNRVGGG